MTGHTTSTRQPTPHACTAAPRESKARRAQGFRQSFLEMSHDSPLLGPPQKSHGLVSSAVQSEEPLQGLQVSGATTVGIEWNPNKVACPVCSPLSPTAAEAGPTVTPASFLQTKGQRLSGERLRHTGGPGGAAEIWTQVRLTPEPLLLTSDLGDGRAVGGGEGALSRAAQQRGIAGLWR